MCIINTHVWHIPPYFYLTHFLIYLHNFRIRSDHNVDKTIEILEKWISSVQHDYHSINAELSRNYTHFSDEEGIAHWSKLRYNYLIALREAALNYARHIWADYILVKLHLFYLLVLLSAL